MTVIELAARAIRQKVAERVGSTATPWDKLFEYQRQGYIEEAKAALQAAGYSPLTENQRKIVDDMRQDIPVLDIRKNHDDGEDK